MISKTIEKYINKKVRISFKEFAGYPSPLEGILKKVDNKYLYYINLNGEKYYFRVSHINKIEEI